MKRVPFYPQENDYYCGPAIVQMVLAAHGKHYTQRQIARVAGTNAKTGTSTKGLLDALAHYTLRARGGNNKTLPQLQDALAKNKIVIICYTEPVLEWGHYAIVKQFKDKNIILLDPDARTGKTSLLIDEFKKRWKDPLFTRSVRWAAFVEPVLQKKR